MRSLQGFYLLGEAMAAFLANLMRFAEHKRQATKDPFDTARLYLQRPCFGRTQSEEQFLELAIASPTGEHSLCVKLDWPHVVALGVAAYLRGSLLQDSVRGTLLVEAAEKGRRSRVCM